MHVSPHPAIRQFFRGNEHEFPSKVSIQLEPEAIPNPEMGSSLGKYKKPVKTKKETRRGRGGNRHQNGGLLGNNFSIWGNNSNGLKAKMKSLKANIEHFKRPSCITIQESKLKQTGVIKINGYKIFEKLRTGLGGGLLTAVIEEL